MASFKKVSPKNWSFRFKYRDKITGKRREIKRQGFQSKPEAVKAYEKIKRTIDFGYDVVKDEKLKEFLYYWLKNYKEGKVAKKTYRLHKRNIENHIVPYDQNILLTDVTYNLHQKFINHLIDKGCSKRTVEIIHGTLYSAMEKAKLQMKIEHNPCKGVSIYTEKEKKKRQNKSDNVRFIPYDKIDDFLKAAIVDNYTYYLFF
ncbi:tyrosine-type recombinase/integrase [Massilibacterium senegalense]|uniref:phage integrase SAM-like domain-containing protein n=1 Tax=Massilibacterium senegalense TaxID=1632858 RepID=UPI0007845FD1|nr:phage integrase SAM-like domain-containing protein [Massilibacterium senegalense]